VIYLLILVNGIPSLGYRDWVKAGVFETIFASVNEDVDLEYAMIDGTIVKVHRHGQGAKGGLSNSL
jgi:transposase